MSSNVILVYPGKRKRNVGFPFSVLTLSSYLRQNGYSPVILDTRVEPFEEVESVLGDSICVGISTMSGSQIAYGLKVAKWIRERNPSVPLVWGGVHPSLCPTSTIQSQYVDIVVRGEGEETLLEVVRTLENDGNLREVRGITYTDEDRIINNPDNPFIDLNTLDLPAYDLLQIEKYPHAMEMFEYESSRGCPFNCLFCYNSRFHRNRWRSKDSNKVFEELERISEVYHPKCIDIIDDNFFADKQQVREICTRIAREKLDIKWGSACRVDAFSRFSKDFLDLLKRAGC